jgi:malonyl-CoA O-methyltransferase
MREFARVLTPRGTLLLTDFHPAAVALGWRRTFRRDGQVYELEHHSYSVGQLRHAVPELELAERMDRAIGEPERELFDRAGRPELFSAACLTPAVLLTHWVRV